MYFYERKFCEKRNEKFKKEFLQLLIETLPNKLTLLPKKKNNFPT